MTLKNYRMMKKLYILFAAAAAALCAPAQEVQETLKYEIHPEKMQYMCKPLVLPNDIDVYILNIGEGDFWPDHSPKEAGMYLALELTYPTKNTAVNEDPGVPVGKFTCGYGWDDKGEYIPYVFRNWSEARHMINDGESIYRNTYQLMSGEIEVTEEDGRYYIAGHVEGKAEVSYGGTTIYPIEVTIPKTEVTPEYSFFGYPEVPDGYLMEQPMVMGSYTEQNYKNQMYWGRYQLEFYTTPLEDIDGSTFVAGEGAVMVLQLNTEKSTGTITPESLAGEYKCESYLLPYHTPLTFTSGFSMETDLVFGATQNSRVTIYDDQGLPTHSSFANSGVVKIEYLGEMIYRIDAEIFNQFAETSRVKWEGPLLDFVRNHPQVAAISDVEADISDAPKHYFDLSGKAVEGELAPGLYIVRQGDRVTKEIVR